MAFKVTKKGPARAAQRTGRCLRWLDGEDVSRGCPGLPSLWRPANVRARDPEEPSFVSYRRSSTDNLLQRSLTLPDCRY